MGQIIHSNTTQVDYSLFGGAYRTGKQGSSFAILLTAASSEKAVTDGSNNTTQVNYPVAGGSCIYKYLLSTGTFALAIHGVVDYYELLFGSENATENLPSKN